MDYQSKCTLKMFPFDLYFNKDGIANILSMGELADRFRLTMDTDVSQGISFHLNKDKVISFTKFMRRVYYYDTKITIVM